MDENKLLDNLQEFEVIKPHVSADMKPENLYLFTLRLCDTHIDHSEEKMSEQFLQEFTASINAKTIPLIKDHERTVDGIVGRIYRAEVVTDATELDELGEPVSYVLGYAFCPTTSNSADFIRSKLYNEVSVSFEAVGHICSICGLDADGDAENHLAEHLQENIDGQLCYTTTEHCIDAIECSFVIAPCQDKAAVSKKSKGGTAMSDVKSTKKDEAPTVEQLQARITELETELDSYKSGNVKSAVSKAIDGLRPINEKLRSKMLGDVDMKKLSLKEDGSVDGLDAAIAQLAEDWAGAFTPEELGDKVKDAAKEVDDDEPEQEPTEEIKEQPETPVTPAEVGGVPITHSKSRQTVSASANKAKLASLFNV